jgi:hypothetical protein
VVTLSKASDAARDTTEAIVKCYHKMFPGTNIFVVSHPIPVYWGHISTLEVTKQLHYPRTAREIGGMDSSDIFCNSDYKHFLA